MFIVLAAAVCFGVTAGNQVPTDKQNVIFLGSQGPVFLQLRIRVDGESYHKAWDNYLDQLFSELDSDGNQTLSGQELRRIPTRQQLNAMGFQGTRQVARPGGRVSRQRLGAYMEKATGGPFTLNSGSAS